MRAWAAFNAFLVGVDFFIILYGVWLAKHKRDFNRHKRVMLVAGGIFVFFLLSFLLKIIVQGVQPFPDVEILGMSARTILFIHEGVAVVTVPLIVIAYWAALTKRFALHKKVVPYAWPLWAFESLFGIVEFYILYFMV